MFLNFFFALRQHGIPVSLHEYLSLLDALKKEVIGYSLEEFYALSKSIFVKHEAHLDRFDKLFSTFFKGITDLPDDFFSAKVPRDWLKGLLEKFLSEEEKEKIKKLGGLDALMERFNELLAEQKKAHQGGNKWIGKGGTSPFGSQGFNPEGFRLGGEGKNRSGIKIWDQRAFQNLDDRVELNTRNIKLILKRLRILTREGLPTELDLDNTIKQTSENAGMLDIALRPSKKNKVKVLMLLDVGGSMDEYASLCEQLFSAAKWEFKHLEFYYFHNCVYESVWRDNLRRFNQRTPVLELIHKFPSDTKLIYVGDAAMSPYEIYYSGGSVEHYNEEPGLISLKKLNKHFKSLVWINPIPEYEWSYYETIEIIRKEIGNRMFPMTIEGLTNAMHCLKNPKKTYNNQVWGDW